MAKDPAFLYYDADAAKDMAHMCRLERGGYIDILHAQKKFGHLSLDIIKKFLGKDFIDIWPSIELVMTKDAEEKYYIEWVDDSIQKRKLNAEKQKNNISKRWNNQKDTTVLPNTYHGNTADIPLVNEIENENVIEKEIEGGVGETVSAQPAATVVLMVQPTDIDLLLEKVWIDKDGFRRVYMQQGMKEDALLQWLKNFNKWLRFTGEGNKTEKDYRKHFGNWITLQDIDKNPTTYEPNNLKNGRKTNIAAHAPAAGEYRGL